MSEKLCELKKKGSSGGTQTETTLWTNPNPSDNFVASTVSLSQSINNFDYLEFVYDNSKNVTSNNKVRIAVSEFIKMDRSITAIPFFAIGYRSTLTTRIFRWIAYDSDTEVYFSTASYWNGTGETNQYVIPIKIVGIK